MLKCHGVQATHEHIDSMTFEYMWRSAQVELVDLYVKFIFKIIKNADIP